MIRPTKCFLQLNLSYQLISHEVSVDCLGGDHWGYKLFWTCSTSPPIFILPATYWHYDCRSITQHVLWTCGSKFGRAETMCHWLQKTDKSLDIKKTGSSVFNVQKALRNAFFSVSQVSHWIQSTLSVNRRAAPAITPLVSKQCLGEAVFLIRDTFFFFFTTLLCMKKDKQADLSCLKPTVVPTL